jgi:ATP-binding cassette subfamily F protein 3
MLRLSGVSLTLAGRPLLSEASATIPTGHKVGLVGRNGTGKTTLFRLIRGEIAPDAGEIEIPRRARIGGVDQEVPAGPVSLLDTVLAADAERAALLTEAETATDPHRIAAIQTRLADIDAHSAEARAATILSGLGFTPAAQARPCADFSGGWRMRVALAGVLFAAPDILLLDEPTNYLDLEGTLWLESFLARYPHTVLVISHDRQLLNRAVTAILHLHDRRLTFYQGGYDSFDETRRARLAVAEAEARKQEAQRAHMQAFVDRFRAKASKARQAQSRLKALARLKPVIVDREGEVARFHFSQPEALDPPILRLEGASAGYGGQPVLAGLDLRIDQDDRIALLGRNGEGKSTLARLIAGRLAPMAGRIIAAPKLRIGYFAQHQVDELDEEATPLVHLQRRRPEEAQGRLRARLAAGGIGAEIATTEVRRLSGGQKARLSLLLATLDAPHLVILDEPTNHLDIESREALVAALTEYSGAVILISHDPHLVELVADRLWLVKDGRVTAWDDDLDAYRRHLLGARESEEREAKPRRTRTPLPDLAPLRAEVARCEKRFETLRAVLATVDSQIADPALYERSPAEMEKWLKKRAEIEEGLTRAEALWLEAMERLEAAEAGGGGKRAAS